MPRADTISEITDAGELLSLEDCSHIEHLRLHYPYVYAIPETIYTLEYPGYCDKLSPTEEKNGAPYLKEIRASSISRVGLPRIKRYHIKELAIKWRQARIYEEEAECYEEDSPGTRLQLMIFFYSKAAEIYKSLISELLPLFREQDRDAVKIRLIEGSVGYCVKRMAGILYGGLIDDIKDKKKAFGITNIPQETIDMWTEYTNLTDAWIAEVNPYRRAYQVYSYNTEQNQVKAGEKPRALWTHPDQDPFSPDWYISPTSPYLKDFLKERQLALNPPPQVGEVISVKFNPMVVLFARSTQRISRLIANSHIFGNDDSPESVRLLDQLEGYKPKYRAPKYVNENDIDQAIMVQEKLCLQIVSDLDQTDIDELLRATNEGMKLLALAFMRYKISLVSKDDTVYFGLVSSNSALDKENYYSMFAFYLENIFQRCLTYLLRLAAENHREHLATAEDAVNDLIEFSHNIRDFDSNQARNATGILTEIEILYEQHDIPIKKDETTGLRRRHVNRA